MTTEIESGIPIPTGQPSRTKFPIGKLEIGQSIFEACDKGAGTALQRRISSRSARYKVQGKRFTVRIVDDEAKGHGVRIWRLPDAVPEEKA